MSAAAQIQAAKDDRRTDIGAALGNSIKLLMIEHATRVLTQEKTRRELAGPFIEDYRRSVRIPTQWNDATRGSPTTSAIRFTARPPATSGWMPTRRRRLS